MLQIAHTPKTKVNYGYNPAFMSAHKTVDTVAQVTLAQDLIKVARQNLNQRANGLQTSRYHFHVINSRNIAVTVILTKQNCIMVRGQYCKNINETLRAIERQTV